MEEQWRDGLPSASQTFLDKNVSNLCLQDSFYVQRHVLAPHVQVSELVLQGLDINLHAGHIRVGVQLVEQTFVVLDLGDQRDVIAHQLALLALVEVGFRCIGCLAQLKANRVQGPADVIEFDQTRVSTHAFARVSGGRARTAQRLEQEQNSDERRQAVHYAMILFTF